MDTISFYASLANRQRAQAYAVTLGPGPRHQAVDALLWFGFGLPTRGAVAWLNLY